MRCIRVHPKTNLIKLRSVDYEFLQQLRLDFDGNGQVFIYERVTCAADMRRISDTWYVCTRHARRSPLLRRSHFCYSIRTLELENVSMFV